MSKAEFRRVFSNVAESASYREKGVYNYSAIPQKALQFLRESKKQIAEE